MPGDPTGQELLDLVFVSSNQSGCLFSDIRRQRGAREMAGVNPRDNSTKELWRRSEISDMALVLHTSPLVPQRLRPPTSRLS